MKAVTYQGPKDVEVQEIADPVIQHEEDVIIRVTAATICGSDLHLYLGVVPLPAGYVIGHESMGIIEETGAAVTRVKKGDRVVVPFTVACGHCPYCRQHLESLCDRANPHADSGGIFGYSEKYGNYPGGQAEYLRVPFGNDTPFRVPDDCELEDESLLLLSDVLPTALWSVEHAGVKKGDTVVVLGAGPVGLMVQHFAWQKGAGRVIAVDNLPYRLRFAKKIGDAETIDFSKSSETGELVREMTGGGADVVIDCVGMDGKKTPLEFVEQKLKVQGGSLGAIRAAGRAVRKGGTVQLTGVYGGPYHAFPLGAFWDRNITLKMGIAPARGYMDPLYRQVVTGRTDPRMIVTHRLPLDDAAHAYDLFNERKDNCLKIILKP